MNYKFKLILNILRGFEFNILWNLFNDRLYKLMIGSDKELVVLVLGYDLEYVLTENKDDQDNALDLLCIIYLKWVIRFF